VLRAAVRRERRRIPQEHQQLVEAEQQARVII
jgi:hypothetical protein